MKQRAWSLLTLLSVAAKQIIWRHLHKCNCTVTQPPVHISPQPSPNSIALSERSQPSPACPSAKISIKIQTNKQHRLNDTDRWNRSAGREMATVPLSPPQAWISHGLNPNRPEAWHCQARAGEVDWGNTNRCTANSLLIARSPNVQTMAVCCLKLTGNITTDFACRTQVFVCDITRYI